MRKAIRWLWHALYYTLAPKSAVSFAMTCKDVTHQIDLGLRPSTWLGKFRFRLHISLCQACAHYLKTTKVLRTLAQSAAQDMNHTDELKTLNQELIKKFSK